MQTKSDAGLVAIAPDVFAWIGASGNSNAGAICTPDGVLVVDTQQHPAMARRMRDAIEARTGRPVMSVINTHAHLDHTAGNIAFDDAPILAHQNTLSSLERELGPRRGPSWTVTSLETTLRLFFGRGFPDLVPPSDPQRRWFEVRFDVPEYASIIVKPPTQTFADRFTYHLSDERIELRHWGCAHTEGDVIVHLVRRKIAFLGDLFFFGRVPWLGDCDIDGWIDTLERILALDIAVVVPGHGPPTTMKAWCDSETCSLRFVLP